MCHFGGQRYSRACAELRMSRYAFLNPAFPRPTEGDAERESGTAGINCKKICGHLSSRTPSRRHAVFGQGCPGWQEFLECTWTARGTQNSMQKQRRDYPRHNSSNNGPKQHIPSYFRTPADFLPRRVVGSSPSVQHLDPPCTISSHAYNTKSEWTQSP